MMYRLSLLLLIAAICFSCKKEKNSPQLAGSWQSVVQFYSNGNWEYINVDSIRAAGKFNYVLNSNRTGSFTRMVIPETTTRPVNIPAKWLPGMGSGTVTTGPLQVPFQPKYKTVAGFWEYHAGTKKMVLLDAQRQTLESWEFEEVSDQQMTTPASLLSLPLPLTNVPYSIKARVVFIKK
ncbi:hypothetical protein [Chitinophaga arvensicola]|uniref:Uncharacterized protein n=1 Tax=Chitinophaga arvensicola TaxID=29529 RepID=A0A1I0S767_9BACT|nr:hypothetical protein [Chitinophaga arvensicola]SEW50040.1 hypothetical protein SAMN04488122_3668 [Chitinophaga arvensicola]